MSKEDISAVFRQLLFQSAPWAVINPPGKAIGTVGTSSYSPGRIIAIICGNDGTNRPAMFLFKERDG